MGLTKWDPLFDVEGTYPTRKVFTWSAKGVRAELPIRESHHITSAGLRKLSGEDVSQSGSCPAVSSPGSWLSTKAVWWHGAFLQRDSECGGISARVQCVLLPLDGTKFVLELGNESCRPD